jgi:hypothetical protein
LKTIDRIFGWLMVISALLHAMGSYKVYKAQPMTLLWAETGGLAELLLAALNLLRAGRPGDRSLAWVSALGCAAWLVAVFAFGRLIGDMLNFRILIQAAVTFVLLVFSLRSALGTSQVGSA